MNKDNWRVSAPTVKSGDSFRSLGMTSFSKTKEVTQTNCAEHCRWKNAANEKQTVKAFRKADKKQR